MVKQNIFTVIVTTLEIEIKDSTYTVDWDETPHYGLGEMIKIYICTLWTKRDETTLWTEMRLHYGQ